MLHDTISKDEGKKTDTNNRHVEELMELGIAVREKIHGSADDEWNGLL